MVRRPAKPGSTDVRSKVDLTFDGNGPALDGVRLTRRSRKGWTPIERATLERDLLDLLSAEAGAFVGRLDGVCKAMNMGDFATAAIASEHLARDLKRAAGRRNLAKASSDDPKHPGWPKGAPDGKGGQFRPTDGASETNADRIKRLVARRGFRSILRRVLTGKRLARLAAEIAGDAVPGLDAVTGAASLIDALKLGADAAADAADTDAAIAFAEEGPQELEDLQLTRDPETFPTYASFKKEDLDKRFGPAGDGFEYHHIVEQGPNAATMPAEQLQSTENIIRIPRLVHEEVNAAFASTREIDGRLTSVRDFLRGKPFAVQRLWGIRVLQETGAIR